jgi:hypothetical protein
MIPSIKRVYEAYALRRRMLHPNWSGDNPRWSPCWRKLAELIDTEEYDLDLYLDAQFEMKSPYPQPNHLYSEAARERYHNYKKTAPEPGEVVIRRIEVELYFLETRLGLGFSLDEIFMMPATPLTPLFCYIVAQLYGREDLVSMFKRSADKYAASHPKARDMYESLIGEEGDRGD